jgi:hypothetical protein
LGRPPLAAETAVISHGAYSVVTWRAVRAAAAEAKLERRTLENSIFWYVEMSDERWSLRSVSLEMLGR